jgi:hypothetical protein
VSRQARSGLALDRVSFSAGCQTFLAFSQFGAEIPSLCKSAPCGTALGITRKLCHRPALGRVPAKFSCRSHDLNPMHEAPPPNKKPVCRPKVPQLCIDSFLTRWLLDRESHPITFTRTIGNSKREDAPEISMALPSRDAKSSERDRVERKAFSSCAYWKTSTRSPQGERPFIIGVEYRSFRKQ